MIKPNLGAEDFAYYAQEKPSLFLRIGARGENEDFIPAHSNAFYAHDESLFIGGLILSEIARKLAK